MVFCLVLKVCCGNWHYMILMESGQVYSWGFNDYGQLGLGSKMDRQVLRAWHGGGDSSWNRRPSSEACNKKYINNVHGDGSFKIAEYSLHQLILLGHLEIHIAV